MTPESVLKPNLFQFTQLIVQALRDIMDSFSGYGQSHSNDVATTNSHFPFILSVFLMNVGDLWSFPDNGGVTLFLAGLGCLVDPW